MPLSGHSIRRRWHAGGLGLGLLAACGSRAEPDVVILPAAVDVSGPQIECLVDEDCETDDLCVPLRCEMTVCVAEPISCVDDDPCTEDGCEPTTGLCTFEHVTADDDDDGHHRPLPGFALGDPGACGDDCNDTSALASPDGVERCDGLDNDCDGVVDNGALFTPSSAPALLLSSAGQLGTPGGLTFSDSAGAYGAVFTQRIGSSQNTFVNIQPGQASLGPAVPVSDVNSDTFAGPIVGRGSILATAWEDRRNQDYEIYFNRLNTRGEKLGPDLRVSNADGFSLRPTLLELPTARGQQYRLAWEDERDGAGGRIYGQRLNGDGLLDGDNLQLTPLGLDPTSPTLVAGNSRIGVLFNVATMPGRGLAFRSFDLDFGNGTDIIRLDAVDPDAASVVANAGRFVVAWHVVQPNSAPGTQIWGSVLGERGELLVSTKSLTEPASFARYHSIVPLGDRLILLWSESRGGRYEIFARELTPELDPLGPARPVTESSVEAYGPLAAFGPQGEIGVLFTGHQQLGGQPHVFFTSLSCEADADFSLPR